MSVVVLLELPAADGQAEALEAFLREMLPVTRLADGCEGLTVTRSRGQATTVTVIQVWQSREQYLAYSRWRQERGDLEPFRRLLQAPPRLGFHDLLGTY
jgi:quinol monooxygenase YgiN